MRKIDIYNHFFPRQAFNQFVKLSKDENMIKRMTNIPSVVDLDVRLAQIKSFGENYCQVISMPAPAMESFGEHSIEMSILANNGMAELVAKYPKQFPAFIASLPLNDIQEAINEAKRAIEQLGARGIQLFTNILGTPLDDIRFKPIFQLMAQYDLPIFLHPVRSANIPDYPVVENKSRFEVWWAFGWPYETSVCMARLVFNTHYFDEFPNIKILTHHLGGMIPFFNGRIGPGWSQLGKRTSDEDYSNILSSMKKPHLDYFKMFYADTALQGDQCGATDCGIRFFGADHVLFASDAPFDPEKGTMFVRLGLETLKSMKLSEENKYKIFEENAVKLLNLT